MTTEAKKILRDMERSCQSPLHPEVPADRSGTPPTPVESLKLQNAAPKEEDG